MLLVQLRNWAATTPAFLIKTGLLSKLIKMRSNLCIKSSLVNEIDLSLESNNLPFNYEISSIGEIINRDMPVPLSSIHLSNYVTQPPPTQSLLNEQPSTDLLPSEVQSNDLQTNQTKIFNPIKESQQVTPETFKSEALLVKTFQEVLHN